MFGGPPRPETDERTEDREAVGSYALVHDLAAIGEGLFANPGRVVELGIECPARGDGMLLGRANKYARTLAIWCPSCSFRIAR